MTECTCNYKDGHALTCAKWQTENPVSDDRELNPIGTADERRAVVDALKHAGYTATDIMSEVAAWANRTRAEHAELETLRERCADWHLLALEAVTGLEAIRDGGTFHAAEVYHYRSRLDAIEAAKTEGDVSEPDGLSPLSAKVGKPCPVCEKPMGYCTHPITKQISWMCTTHGSESRYRAESAAIPPSEND